MSFLKSLSTPQALEIVKTIMLNTDANTIEVLNKIFIELIELNYHLEIIKVLLLDSRVDPSLNGNKAIISASENGLTDIVAILLSDPSINPGDHVNAPIGFAAKNGHTSVVELLLKDPRVDPIDDNNYALVEASRYNRVATVKLLLLDPRINPSAMKNNALNIASLNGHIEIVKLLLQDPRVDPNNNINKIIESAFYGNHLNIVKLLLPKIDLSKITYTKILDIAKEMNLIPKVVKILPLAELKEFMMEQMRNYNMCSLCIENGEMTYSCKL